MSSHTTASKRHPQKVPNLSQTGLRNLLKTGEKGETIEQQYVVTPTVANFILSKLNGTNRTLNDTHLASIVRDIKAGNWVEGTGSMVSFAKNGELVDGQHRLGAIVRSKTPLRLSFKFGISEDAKRVIDTGRKRTFADFITMTEGHDAKYKTERASVTRLVYGFLHDQHHPHGYTNNIVKPTQSDLYTIAEEFHEDIADAVQKALGPGHVQKVTVGSYAAFVYLLAAASDYGDYAQEFMGHLSTGANMEANNPIMVARNRLLTRDEYRSAKNKDRTIGLLVKTWNLWIRDKTVSAKMHSPDEVPKVIGLDKLGRHKLYRKK